MASTSFSPVIVLSFLLLSSISTTTGQPPSTPSDFEMGSEKQTHLHFFFQDLIGKTAILVASNPNSTNPKTSFGALTTIDNQLTEGPDQTSKVVGRAQGIYAIASIDPDTALLMTMNLVFTDGDYSGSSITVVGRNQVSLDVREMPVVGGSGYFRWASGYALAKTRTYDTTTGDASVEYDVYVIHH